MPVIAEARSQNQTMTLILALCASPHLPSNSANTGTAAAGSDDNGRYGSKERTSFRLDVAAGIVKTAKVVTAIWQPSALIRLVIRRYVSSIMSPVSYPQPAPLTR
ncbi:hypothetical protein BHJ80_20990 [Escherichia coli]|nr:hypothetical protein BHJ80_20990 [Escherichia coli]